MPSKPLDAVTLAHKMGRAAGKVQPELLAEAAYMLICCACMAKDPSKYADLMAAREANGNPPQPPKA